MKRSPYLFLLALAGVLITALGVAALAVAAAPRAQLRHPVCHRGLDPAQRAVDITAAMRPVAGTQDLALRFALLRRKSGAKRFTPIAGGDLGRWVTPANPTLGRRPGDVWILHKQVMDLAAPADYRLRVTFRWRGPGGRVLRRVTRSGPACHQPELRPDLLVRRLGVQPIAGSKAGRTVYLVAVSNRGATAAGPFAVRLAPAAGAPLVQTVPGVPAHGTVRVRFSGPACTPGGRTTVTLDPAHQVDEYDRANDVASFACPAA